MVMLWGLARRGRRKPREHHYLTPDVRAEEERVARLRDRCERASPFEAGLARLGAAAGAKRAWDHSPAAACTFD